MAAAELMSILGVGLNESAHTIAQTWRQVAQETKRSMDGAAGKREGWSR